MPEGYSPLLFQVLVAIGTAAGAWLAIRKLENSYREERKKEGLEVLAEAAKTTEAVRKDLEASMAGLRQEIASLGESVDKDVAHIKETYNGEIRNLGGKIEELRTEVRQQHSKLMDLLTRLVDGGR